jgi:hypothetical protein
MAGSPRSISVIYEPELGRLERLTDEREDP